MKDRWVLLIILVIIVTLISTGCGISQSRYDAVSIELDLVKQDRQALQTQLQESQSELIVAKTDLVRAQVMLETAQTDLETTQGQLQAAQTDRQTAQTQLQESQSELAQTKTDLQSGLAQVQSLQNDLNAAKIIPAKALSYAEFMDIVMFELWLVSGVTPNFTFSSAGEQITALENRATGIGDATLINFVDKMKKGLVVGKNEYVQIGYYCLDKLEAILK
jgi:multidrug efflux pump subunit AcrA (membrane-fusion protein)